jgi:hypothetical protein
MRIRDFITAGIVVLASVGALPAQRPGPIEVREAVERSRAEYKALHPPVSQKEAAHKVDEEVQVARAKLGQAYKIRSPKQRAAAMKEANKEIAALVAEANAIVKDYKPEDRHRLMPLQLGGIAVGSVGRLTEKGSSADGLGYEHRFVRCIKVLNKDEMIAVLEYREAAPKDDPDSRPEKIESSRFILKGIPVSASTEKQLLTGVYDVVVTAQQDYSEPDGEPMQFYVLEVFDPDKPFR